MIEARRDMLSLRSALMNGIVQMPITRGGR
jgi:hypothetical protein